MKKVKLSFILSVFLTTLNAQNVLQIGDRNIPLEEFKSVFYKNKHDSDITKEYLDEYMNLFVNFKLKVIEAQELGLVTNISFINELEGYRKQLAKPYLKDKKFDAEMLSESYNRIKKDVNASHILISLKKDAPPNETKSAYEKALDIRKSIINESISFSEAAKKYSDDKSALSNNGNLGYFTAFMMVYNFETAAYETKIGKISMPVRTKYGYHLVKVNDRRDAVGKVKVAHIMFKTGKGANNNKINDAKNKIEEALERIKNGEEFKNVAEKFSEDRSTAVNGGVLPTFGVGKMVPEFENYAFSLEKSGDMSIPFLTDYGWHILQLIEKEPIGSFSETEAHLKRMIEKDSRGELSNKALFKKLHKSYKIKNKPKVYKDFRKRNAIQISKGTFNKISASNKTLFTIEDLDVSVNEFEEYILLNQSTEKDIDNIYINFVNDKLLDYEDSKLGEKYPEYKALLKEYREGILLFDLTNKKVWTKAIEDSSGLQKFFNQNQLSYTWPRRVDATIYECANLDIAKKVKREIHRKNRGKITNEEILKKINSVNALNLQITRKKFIAGENKHIDSVSWEAGISKDLVLNDGSYIIIDIHSLLEAKNKELDETRGKVISDYQSALEQEWIYKLKSKYPIIINSKALYSLIE